MIFINKVDIMASVKQSWIKKYGEVEGLRRWEERKKLSANTLENFIRKHGEVGGVKKWEEYKNKLKKRGTKMWYIERYGKVGGTKKYLEKNSKLSVSTQSLQKNGFNDEEICEIRKKHSEKSKRTKDNFIKENGKILGTKKYNEYREKNRLTSSWSLNYWLDKLGGDIDKAKEELKKHQNRNIEWWVSKYGEIDGKRKYNEYVKKITKNLSGFNVSKSQKEVEEYVRSIYDGVVYGHEDNYGVILTQEEREKVGNNILYPDIYLKDTNIIIRYNGDFWHASEYMFGDNLEHVLPKINKSVSYIRDKDRKINEIYDNRSIKVITIWENEWENNKKNIKLELKNMLS
jgi:G:T-mismatch repair DNA endonuclease (very short patch repair protein)